MKAGRVRVYPLGHPLEIISTSEEALEATREQWGRWPQLFGGMPPWITIDVHDGPAAALPPNYRAAGADMLLYSDPGNLGSFSAEVRSGLLRVSRATLARREWFGHHFFTTLVLTALDMLFFDPLQAACVTRGERGLVLAGESGAGKTTLAYACTKAGWTLVSEEGVHLAADAAHTLVGGFWVLRLREPARALFAELRGLPLEDTLNGKQAILVDVAARGLKTAWETRIGKTVFLSRRPGPAAISPFAQEVALAYFLQTARQPDRAGSEKRIREMLGQGCYLLEYEVVEQALAELERLA
jgi:hypothetical protein